MIHLYYWPTAHGREIKPFLDKASRDYRIRPIDVAAGGPHSNRTTVAEASKRLLFGQTITSPARTAS